jgi:unsaturated rhamnogalacturonyl hydrolase
MKRYYIFILIITSLASSGCSSLSVKGIEEVDAHTKLYLSTPDYKTPYGETTSEEIKALMDKVFTYVDACTPIGVLDKNTQEAISDYSKIDKNSIIENGTFSITNYMWGVTYSSMLSAANITGDTKYKDYVANRLTFLCDVAPYFEKVMPEHNADADPQMRQLVRPQALDDAGAMSSAMIKAKLAGLEFNSDAVLDKYVNFIMHKEYHLPNGIFARNRPQRNTVWLDDMFMGVPTMAYMGKLTGDTKYYDEAIKQILLFEETMFMPEKGLYRHGWVEAMDPRPAFHWGRANGWALLATVEVLSAVPEDYPERDKVLSLLQAHIKGLCAYQSSEGLWHQLLDRNDSYLETSATAIYTYCMAKAINEGWIDALAYGSQTILGWHGLSTRINAAGQIEGTCVGTGMAFDPAFYYCRPVNTAAGHGYGPFFFAGAEMIRLSENNTVKMNDSALLLFKE